MPLSGSGANCDLLKCLLDLFSFYFVAFWGFFPFIFEGLFFFSGFFSDFILMGFLVLISFHQCILFHWKCDRLLCNCVEMNVLHCHVS